MEHNLIKKYSSELRKQIRTERLDEIKSTVRKLNQEKQIKEDRRQKFLQIQRSMHGDYMNPNHVQELQNLVTEQNFILKEPDAHFLLAYIKLLFKQTQQPHPIRSEYRHECSYQWVVERRNNSILALCEFFQLFRVNAEKNPKFGSYDHVDILNQIMLILKETIHQRIRDKALIFVCYLVLNPIASLYLLKNEFLSIISLPLFGRFSKLIQNLFTNFFVKLSKAITIRHVESLLLIFDNHIELYSKLDGQSVSYLLQFVINVTEDVKLELKKQRKYIELMFNIMVKIHNKNILQSTTKDTVVYARILRCILNALIYVNQFSEDRKNAALKNLEIMWELHQNAIIQYNRIQNKIQDHNDQQRNNQNQELSRQREGQQQIIRSFVQIFQFCLTWIGQNEQVRMFLKRFLLRFYKIFCQKEQIKNMIAPHFFILFKYYKDFKPAEDFQRMIELRYIWMEDGDSRKACLKKLSQWARQSEKRTKEYYKLKDYYNQFKKERDWSHDRFTDYLFAGWVIPNEKDIQLKEKEFKIRLLWEMKEDQKNLYGDVDQKDGSTNRKVQNN